MLSFKTFMEQTWNGGMINLFQMDPIMQKGSRHRANIIPDTSNRKNLQTVPEYKKSKSDLIQKVEKLKDKFSHYEPINSSQLKEICKKYKIYSVSKTEPKKLGNTGIAIVWDNNLNTFAIKK